MASPYNLGRLLLDIKAQQQVLVDISAEFDAAEKLWAADCTSRVFHGVPQTEDKVAPNVKGFEKRFLSSAQTFGTVMASLELEYRPEDINVDYSDPDRHIHFIRSSLHWILTLPPTESGLTLSLLYVIAFLYLLPKLKSKVCRHTEGELARRFFANFDTEFEIDFCGDLDRRSTKSSILKRCAKVPLEIALKWVRRYEILITDPEMYAAAVH